jgi:3-deoxy-D-manno-octulosonic-acid transferase
MNLLDLLYLPAAAITAPWWARKTRSGWGERFGHIPKITRGKAPAGTGPAPQTPAPTDDRPRILLHAVSVGEVNTLRGLVPMLVERGCEVVVSVSTDTGIKRARELFGSSPSTHITRYPLDFSPAVNRFLGAVNPDLVALVELEVWPNFIRACRVRNIPVGVINGRLSARSFRGYKRLRPFLRQTFAGLAFVGAQDSAYAERFRAMGVPDDRLTITGSMKWDAVGASSPALREKASQLARDLHIDPNRPLIVAGSTAPIDPPLRTPSGAVYDCEEALLHAVCPAGVQLLCAPRKPEHFERAFQALGGAGRCTRRSAGAPGPPANQARFLLDTIGELACAYALASIAVVGRTWGDLGGSDPIESIALGKPTILGPRYANFESIVQTFAAGGAIVIVGAADLAKELRDLLADPARQAELARRGLACIQSQQGATTRHADLILATLRTLKPAPQ